VKEFPTKEGKYGLIYQVAEGVNVNTSVDGTYELAINHQGKRSRKRQGYDLEKALARAELVAIKLGSRPKCAEADLNSPYTMEDAARDWMRTNKHRWTSNTLERYSGLVRDFVLPSLGAKPIDKVTRPVIKDLLADILEIRSAKHVELLHAVISGIFNEINDRGLANENPAHGLLKKLLPPKRRRAERRPDPLSRSDLTKLIEAAWKVLDEPLALITETIACSGMRLGECLAMHRDRIDVSSCQYMVNETILKDGRRGIPKGGDERLIDMEPQNVKKLEAYLLRLRKEALRDGCDVGYLFHPRFAQRHVQRGLKRACRAARVRVRSPHDLRHTYATLLLMDHYSPAYVQKQLGHHSITMTVDIYGHWIPGEGRKDLRKTLRGHSSIGEREGIPALREI